MENEEGSAASRGKQDAMIANVSYVTERLRIADELEALTPSEIRLAMGEMTAQEMRNVLAFIGWRVAVLRRP